ncbi:MAG: methionyl-tRNA formyltransferase [Phycisphaerales bacterium]|nr:methionyl-tRNA formyltransferase [Phycisphaerales bacterium]
MKIVFLGSGAFGIPTLDHLARKHTITGIVTQPDRKAGRKKVLTATPIGAWADEHLPGVPVLKPKKINADEPREIIRNWNTDAWVVIAYGQYLGTKLLDDRFAINLHASLLPRWRGAAPINAAMVAGDKVTGNSVITIAKSMDAGFVLGQSKRTIEPNQTVGTLHDLLASDGPALVQSVLDDFANDRVNYQEQDESLVTTASKMAKSDGWIEFNDEARMVSAKINGLSPWPGVSVQHRDEVLKINRSQPYQAESQQPTGTIIDAVEGLVACGHGTVIQLLDVQPPGKRSMEWNSYANGRKIESGEIFVGKSGA